MTDVLRVVKEKRVKVEAFPIAAGRLGGLVHLRLGNALSSTGAQEVFALMLDDEREAESIARGKKLLQISDDEQLLPVIRDVLAEFPAQVETYRGGKTQVVGFFIGQVMRRTGGSADPVRVRELLLAQLAP